TRPGQEGAVSPAAGVSRGVPDQWCLNGVSRRVQEATRPTAHTIPPTILAMVPCCNRPVKRCATQAPGSEKAQKRGVAYVETAKQRRHCRAGQPPGAGLLHKDAGTGAGADW